MQTSSYVLRVTLTIRQQLRDIFTFHPNTGCHTHELLDCPCARGGAGDYDGGFDTEAEEEEMTEIEQRMLKGFVTAASLSPKDVDNVDKTVRGTWFPNSECEMVKSDALITVRSEEESATRSAR